MYSLGDYPNLVILPIGFLMYPYAEAPDGPIDSLDPASFTYSIFAQEIV